MANVKIAGVGSYVPKNVKTNQDFLSNQFYTQDESKFDAHPKEIIEKFKAITGIAERRYADDHMKTSDIAAIAAQKAIVNAGVNQEDIDYIIVAHNFGDVEHQTQQTDIVPSIASRVKQILKIKNPKCVAYDLVFGCPGWIEGCIQSKAFIDAGLAKRTLVIGAETLSRVIDPHDRDSMIYADGAGATILELTEDNGGILSHQSATFSLNEAKYIFFDKSNSPQRLDNRGYIKMYGRRIYNFALTKVPEAMKACLDESGHSIDELKCIFIHQANEKMDEAIVKRFYKLYKTEMPEGIMPMSISELGNSSVATVPTLYDLYLQGYYGGQEFKKGDLIMFASVGAGMNINAITYQI